MIKITLATLAASAVLLSAVPAFAAANSVGGKVYPLEAVGGSGEYGTVALKPMGLQTEVEIHVVNAPAGLIQTVHIHKGTCASVDGPPVYPLSPLVDGTSTSVIDVPLDKLLTTPLVVHVHRSYKKELSSLACASLSPQQ
ncbi:MAG: hypothetical protein ACLPYS_19150 [Vulcanimicrobiaceae bacterium]